VVLRGWEEGDAEAVTAACQDPEIPRFTRVPSPYTLADARAFIAFSAASDGLSLAITAARDGVLLGSVALHGIDWGQGSGELGYWVAREGRGRGIASHATRLLAGWALQDVGLARVTLHADVVNVASQAVARRAGFTRERVVHDFMGPKGVRRDIVCFALAREHV
jgi:RimJ/RimL family protein N-acetyltransferase